MSEEGIRKTYPRRWPVALFAWIRMTGLDRAVVVAAMPVLAGLRPCARWSRVLRAGLRQRRSHHLHVVLFHEPLVRVRIHTLSLREHLFEATGRHTEKQYTWMWSDVLKGVRSVRWDEDESPNGYAHHAITHFELELAAHDINELNLQLVQMRRRPTSGRSSSK